MTSFVRVAFLGALFTACAPSNLDQESNTAAVVKESKFVYAPVLERPHHERMRRTEDFSIPGSSLRNVEEWVMDWVVVVRRESNLFKRSMTLVSLKIDVNGAVTLRSDAVKENSVTIDVLTDKDSNVVDVRGTEQFSNAIASLGTPEAQPIIRRVFSPERLKALAIERSVELHADFVGRPAAPGSVWMANDANKTDTRQVRVIAEAACGAKRCVQVRREYEIDRQAVFAEVAQRVGAYVQSQGGDPSQVAVTGMQLKLQDSMLIEPATTEYYGAQFVEEVQLDVKGPNGDIPVKFNISRQTDYRY